MENPTGNSNGSNNRDNDDKRYGRKRAKAVKSTPGPAPRKMLGPKGKKYFYDKRDGKVAETETQTYKSTSDVQVQVEKETKSVECQTDFNSRFYIERSDKMAQDPNYRPYGWESEDDY